MESQQVLTDSVDAQKMERFLQELSKPSTSQEYLQSVIKQTRGLSETTELRNAFGQHALNSDDRIKIYKEIASRKDNTESVHGLLREASKSNEEKECSLNDFGENDLDEVNRMFDNLSREQSDKFSISHTGNDKFGHDQYSIAFSGDQGRRESHQVSSGHTIYDSVEGTFNSISIKNTRRALDSALSENLPKDNPHAWADMWNSIHNVADTPVATPLPGSPVLREPPSPITSRPPSLEPDVPPEKRGSYYNLEAQIVLEVTLAQNIPRNFSEQAQEIISKRVQEYKLFSDMNVRTGGDKYTHLEYAESLKGEFLERLNNLSHSTHSSPHSSPKETSSPQPTAHDDGPSMEGAESSAAQTRPLKRAASNASSSHKSDVEMERAESSAGQPGPLRKSARIANAPLGQLPTPSPRNPGGSSRQGPQRG